MGRLVLDRALRNVSSCFLAHGWPELGNKVGCSAGNEGKGTNPWVHSNSGPRGLAQQLHAVALFAGEPSGQRAPPSPTGFLVEEEGKPKETKHFYLFICFFGGSQLKRSPDVVVGKLIWICLGGVEVITCFSRALVAKWILFSRFGLRLVAWGPLHESLPFQPQLHGKRDTHVISKLKFVSGGALAV